MKKHVVLGIFFGLSLFALPNTAHAGQYGGCSEQYGGQTCPGQELLINKTVKDPKTGAYVDGIGNNDNKYSPEETASFKITVTNSGSDTLNNLSVQDMFPEFIQFISGPGSFDNNSKTLTFEIAKLNPGESKDFYVEGKIASAHKLPADQGIVCVVNKAQVKLNGRTIADNAQVCIEKQVLGQTKGGLKVFPAPKAVKTPPTGPEAIALIALIPSAFVGLKLRGKSKQK